MRLLKSIFTFIYMMVAGAAAGQSPVYFCSGNWNPPASWNQGSAVLMGSVANTHIQTGPATAVGNCYFRFYSATSGGINYAPGGNNDSLMPVDTPFNLTVSGGFGKSFYIVTQDTTDNYIFKTTGYGAPGNARAAVIRVQGPVQYVTGLVQNPAGNVYANQDVTVTATISDTFSAGQGVYLRYTADGWNSSAVIPMSGSGVTYAAVIPGAANTTNADINYYVFTSGSGITIAPGDADLMTINLYNNNFYNFSYVPQCIFQLDNTQFELVETDKARYAPGDSVKFTALFNSATADDSLRIIYLYWGDTVGVAAFAANGITRALWSWFPPTSDYRGYMADVELVQNGGVIDSTSIAIDVSSDWNKFPRYGFLSAYPQIDSGYAQTIFTVLNRYHLNGLQFYDVNHKHDIPLAGTVAQPDSEWNDIANRSTYLTTVQTYIGMAHSCNMKAMNYNLIYGAYANSEAGRWRIAAMGNLL